MKKIVINVCFHQRLIEWTALHSNDVVDIFVSHTLQCALIRMVTTNFVQKFNDRIEKADTF